MKLSTFFVLWCIIYAVFGLGLYLVPHQFMSIFGVPLDQHGGELMARVLGATLTSFAVLFWFVRNVPLTEKLQRNILLANFVYAVIDTPVAIRANMDGTMDGGGWIPVMVHVFLVSTMAYFLFIKKEQSVANVEEPVKKKKTELEVVEAD